MIIMHFLLSHLVAVGSVRTEGNVCHCTEKTITSLSAKDSREKTAKMVRNTPTHNISLVYQWFLAKYSCVTEW